MYSTVKLQTLKKILDNVKNEDTAKYWKFKFSAVSVKASAFGSSGEKTEKIERRSALGPTQCGRPAELF